jgi:(E)-4-hydroxy-3-methylbut-2-enyl-diphosphate synthase
MKDPTLEVEVAYEILKNLGLSQRGPTLVSCPTCGRTEVDLVSLAEKLEERLKKVKKPLKVAAMGCRVNGIGEAKDADVGLACGKGKGVIFRKGEIVRTVEEKDFLTELMAEVEK